MKQCKLQLQLGAWSGSLHHAAVHSHKVYETMQGNIVLSVVLLGVVAVLVLCGGVDGTVVGLKPNAVPQLRVSGSMFDVGRAVGTSQHVHHTPVCLPC